MPDKELPTNLQVGQTIPLEAHGTLRPIDFPTAWKIARASRMEDHHPRCSYPRTEGALLCDCYVLYPEQEPT